MTRDEIARDVQQILRDALGKPDLQVHDQLNAADVTGWDSFTHVSILDNIERHFKIRFGLSEIDQLTQVGDILDAVAKKRTR